MAIPSYRKARRFLGSFLATNRNKLAGRSFVPHPRRSIFIETSARCNLACRFCLYDKIGPGQFMDHDSFLHAVDEATGLGFRFVWLTPMIGEVFADPGTVRKFDALEAHPGIEGFSFYSNFIMPKPETVAGIGAYKKLTEIHISLYGYDEESFTLTTRKPATQFRKLEENLKVLFDVLEDAPAALHFSIRTVKTDRPFLAMDTPFTRLMERFRDERGASFSMDNEFDDWAGTITPEDVRPLGVELTSSRQMYKHGACTRIFNEVKIKVDGKISVCAPRDVDGSLVVGNVSETPLRDILSPSNPRYKRIIDDQHAGRFPEVCRSCAIYRSVLDHRAAAQDPGLDVMGYDTALSMMSK